MLILLKLLLRTAQFLEISFKVHFLVTLIFHLYFPYLSLTPQMTILKGICEALCVCFKSCHMAL